MSKRRWCYLLGAHVGFVFAAGMTGLLVMLVMEFLQKNEVLHFNSLAIAGVMTAVAKLVVNLP